MFEIPVADLDTVSTDNLKSAPICANMTLTWLDSRRLTCKTPDVQHVRYLNNGVRTYPCRLPTYVRTRMS